MFSTKKAVYVSIKSFKSASTPKQSVLLLVILLLVFIEIQSAVLFSQYSGRVYESLFQHSESLLLEAVLGFTLALLAKPIVQATRSFIGSLLALEWRIGEFNRLLSIDLQTNQVPYQEQRLQEDLALFTQTSIKILTEVVFEWIQAFSFYHLIKIHPVTLSSPFCIFGLHNIIVFYVCLGTYIIHNSQSAYIKTTYEKENLEANLRKEIHDQLTAPKRGKIDSISVIIERIYRCEYQKMIQENLLIFYPGLLSATSILMTISLTAPLVMHQSLSIESYVQLYALANQLTWSLMCFSRQSVLIGQWKSSCFRYWETQHLSIDRHSPPQNILAS